MSVTVLEKFLPPNALPHLKFWFGNYSVHLKITKNRNSKLGDYRRFADQSHQITINGTLAPELFFFVLTHELAHLIAFEEHKNRRILPHGEEWKSTYRSMLLQSLQVYSKELQPLIVDFSHAPKANFMAATAIVQYFEVEKEDGLTYINDFQEGELLLFRDEIFEFVAKRRKSYLCINKNRTKRILLQPLARVQKIEKL